MSMRKGDKVRVIGACGIQDFLKAEITSNSSELCEELGLPILVQLEDGRSCCIDSICLFKEDSWIYKLMKIIKRKKYAEYQRTYKNSNEV